MFRQRISDWKGAVNFSSEDGSGKPLFERHFKEILGDSKRVLNKVVAELGPLQGRSSPFQTVFIDAITGMRT